MWTRVPLKEVARIVGGATPKTSEPDLWDGPICWATPKDLSELSGKFISSTPRTISSKGLASCSAELLPLYSVLFSSRAPIGHVAINTVPMATNQGFKSMVPGPKLDPNFLYWWLDANREPRQSLGVGATFKEVSKTIVERIEIPLPPLEEQKYIAAILDQADALRRLRARGLDRIDALGQAIFHEMFGSNSDDDQSWFRLGECLSFMTSGGRGWAQYYAPSGSRFIRSLDVQMNHIGSDDVVFVEPPNNSEAKRTRVCDGDVLLTITGSKIGRVSPVSADLDGAFVSQHVAILRPKPDTIDPVFLSYFLSMEDGGQLQIRKNQYGQAKPGLNFEQIGSFKIPRATIAQQRRFKRAISAIYKTASEAVRHASTSEALFASLQHRAFRGEL